MSLTLVISLLMAVQSAPLAAEEQDSLAQSEAAYEELSAGQTDEAIHRLEAALKDNHSDPALLINLGTAYTRAGRYDEARDAFRAAIASEDRYQLQLADGTWEDSRKAARIALNSLDETRAFAAK